MDYPIVYSSRKLNKAQRNYLTTEREALGMVFALQKYLHYLLDNPFIFYTEHQELKYLVNKPLHHGRFVDGYYSKNSNSKLLSDQAS